MKSTSQRKQMKLSRLAKRHTVTHPPPPLLQVGVLLSFLFPTVTRIQSSDTFWLSQMTPPASLILCLIPIQSSFVICQLTDITLILLNRRNTKYVRRRQSDNSRYIWTLLSTLRIHTGLDHSQSDHYNGFKNMIWLHSTSFLPSCVQHQDENPYPNSHIYVHTVVRKLW